MIFKTGACTGNKGVGAAYLRIYNKMNLRLRRFIILCLSVICLTASVGAQKNVPERSTTKFPDPELRLRKQQLGILNETFLSRTVDSIKKMDEVALRISARKEILAYLWENKTVTNKHINLTRDLAIDAITDLSNDSEIPPFMIDYLSADLAALIEKYQPDLTEKLQATRKTAKSGKQAVDVASLFELKNGDVLAATRIRQLLAQGDDVKELNFWLENLRKQRSSEFEPLLHEVVAIAKRGPQISFETLLWLNPIYFQSEVPQPLQRSFATMIVSRTQPINFIVTPAPQSAYELLSATLSHIQQLLPELYDQATNQSLALRAAINQTQLDREERNKRLKDSLTPIEDLIGEAEATKTKSERNELLAEAAELALRKEKFSTCLDIVAKLDLEITVRGQADFWQNWSSQFAKKLVKNAAAAKDFEIAEKAALGMRTSLAKVQAVVLVMRQRSEVNNKDATHRLLREAIRIAETISDGFEKAKAFLLLSITCNQVDESQKAQLLLSCVKALNSLNKPTTPREHAPYQEYLRNLDNTGYQVIRGFKDLTTKDENAAISLVDQIHTSDLRTFALIGILSGLNELLAKNED
mgnify:CR=1 FL=1